MSDPSPNHLTEDELDALLLGAGSPRAMSHLATCTSCAAMRALDTRLVTALGTLPMWEPAAGFSNRVMARVSIHPVVVAQPLPLTARERSARRRVVVASLAAGSALAAGFVWAVAHPAAAAFGWSTPALADAGQSLWVTLQSVAEQPWLNSIRGTLTTPARAFPVLVGALGAYALALVGLSRLLTEPATDARW
jgi:hypothetical protein